jgi:hypothetical protein
MLRARLFRLIASFSVTILYPHFLLATAASPPPNCEGVFARRTLKKGQQGLSRKSISVERPFTKFDLLLI